MTRDDLKFWHRVSRARSLVESGAYDDSEIFADFLSRGVDHLLDDLQNCPVGDGNRYRDIVAETLATVFSEIVDVSLIQREFPCQGGRGDIELPLRSEVMPQFPVWSQWHARYSVHSVVVECKNLDEPAAVGAVQQVLAYLVTGGRGGLGLVVARNGFTAPAMKQLVSIARTERYLILPLSNDDLRQLVQATTAGDPCAMTFLRRKQALLTQAS